MAAKKGHIKSGGRKAGTPNKSTQDMRAWINELLNDSRDLMILDLGKLEPKDRLMILEKFMQYAIPRMQSLSIEGQLAAEYSSLEKLLNIAPDKAIEVITEKILKLNQLNKLEK